MSIKPLSKETIKLINSTQVITSIYSAVKELVENSLDAQAQNIEVNLVDNGLSLIEVKDNGIGIAKEDAQFMGLPSYTSKLQNFNDLDLLSTYGFRGEGLTAICQVSDVTVSTKTAEDETLTRYTLDYEGYIVSSEISHGLNGTTVQMRNLFKNMPVRRNILNNKKRINQEVKAVELLLKNYAMCKPSIRFVFRVNSNTVFMKPSYKNLIEAVKSVLKMQVYSRLHYIKKNFEQTEIQLFIPKTSTPEDLTQIAQTGLQFVCVNERPIKSKQIEKQINKRISEYFNEGVATSRKYIFCLVLKVEPTMLDVNLEPNKDKVFLQNEAIILTELDNILRDYYGLINSQMSTQNDIENVNINANLNEVAIEKVKNKETDKELPAPKKRKIEEQNSDIHDSVDVTNKNVEPSTTGEVPKKSIDEFLKTLSQPILSDVDSEDEFQKKIKDRNETEKPEQMEIEPIQTPESEDFDLGTAVLKNNDMERLDERFSQLPVVDLGGDFDWKEIVHKCNKKLSEQEKSESAKRQEVNDIAWSKGQVPGLQGGVSIGLSNQDSEMFDLAENIKQIDDDDASTSRNETPDINELQWDQTLKNPKKRSTKAKPTTPSTSKFRKSINDLNQTSIIPFAGDNACLSAMGPSAFAMYCAKARIDIVKDHPEYLPAEVAAELNKRWKKVSVEEREYYRDLANEQRQNNILSLATPKTQKSQISEFEKEKNRKQLVNMLGNMKSNKAEIKNESMIMRSYAPWNISLPSLTDKFKKLVTKEIPLEGSKMPIIVGSLNALLWIAKFTSSLYLFDISELQAQLSITGCDMTEINTEYVSDVVDKWMTEKNDMSVFHPFYEIKNQ